MTPPFISRIELARPFYAEIVAPLLAGEPGPHAAALLGPGSEVLGVRLGPAART